MSDDKKKMSKKERIEEEKRNLEWYRMHMAEKEEGMSDIAKHIQDIEKAIHHLQMEITQLQIDNLMKEGMSYEKAIKTLERINDLKKLPIKK